MYISIFHYDSADLDKIYVVTVKPDHHPNSNVECMPRSHLLLLILAAASVQAGV